VHSPRTEPVKVGRRAALATISTIARLYLEGREHGGRIACVGIDANGLSGLAS